MMKQLEGYNATDISIGLATAAKIKKELGVDIQVKDAIESYKRLDKYEQAIQFKSLQDNGYFN